MFFHSLKSKSIQISYNSQSLTLFLIPFIMDIVNSSPAGRVFMPSSPSPQPQHQGIDAFDPNLRREFERFLEGDNNRTIFTQAKRMHYKRWIENPNSKPLGDNIQAQNHDRNFRNRALSNFIIDDGQLYRKPGMSNGSWLDKCYVACYSDAYEIITRTHKQLLHAGIFFNLL
jgi:hypothetical protein